MRFSMESDEGQPGFVTLALLGAWTVTRRDAAH